MKAHESKHYREICALSMGQVECIIASEHAPDDVWIMYHVLQDWLVKRAEGQYDYKVQKEVEQIKRKGEPAAIVMRNGQPAAKRFLHRLDSEVTCAMVEE